MTEGTLVAVAVALIASATTVAMNWSVLRSDHAGLKRIVLLNQALGEMDEESPGKEGLRQVRETLAQRTAVRMLPGGAWSQDLKVAARVLTVLSMFLILTAVIMSVSSGPAWVVNTVAIFAAATTIAARFCLFARERLIVRDLHRSVDTRTVGEVPIVPGPPQTDGI